MGKTLKGKEKDSQEFMWYFPWTDAGFKDDCSAVSGALEATEFSRSITLTDRNKAYRFCFCHALRERGIFSNSLFLGRILHM